MKGKALGIFQEYVYSKYEIGYYQFLELPLVCQQALWVEWFRSVNIVVDVTPFFEGNDKSLTIIKWMPNPIHLPITNDSEVYDFEYESEHNVALSKAIEKAIEIFNNQSK